MITTKLTPSTVGISTPTVKREIRPPEKDTHPALERADKSSTSSLDNRFYKLMAFLLILIGGCKDSKPDKPEGDILNQVVQNQLLLPPDPTNKRDVEFEKEFAHLEKNLFSGHLLDTLDKLDKFVYDSNGKAIDGQMLLSKRLEPEVFPLLWNKVFLEGPDQVIVAEHTKLGEFSSSNDFGRGLRLVLRKKVGELNISTILFLDYNERTKKLEFPEDIFFNDKRKIVPDVMRTLIEYDVAPTPEQLKGRKKNYDNNHLDIGFFGTTFAAELDEKTSKLTNFHIYPTKDENDEHPIGRNGRTINAVSLLSCVGCHGDNKKDGEGFIGTFTSFEETQRSLQNPSHQDKAIRDFIAKTKSSKHFNSPEEERAILGSLETMLRNPKDNLHKLLPTDFLETLERKQSTFTDQSPLLRRYNAIALPRLTN